MKVYSQKGMIETREVTRTIWEGGIVVVEEFLAVEGHETLKDAVADTSSTNSTDDLAFEVIGVAGDLRNLPVAPFDHLAWCEGI